MFFVCIDCWFFRVKLVELLVMGKFGEVKVERFKFVVCMCKFVYEKFVEEMFVDEMIEVVDV